MVKTLSWMATQVKAAIFGGVQIDQTWMTHYLEHHCHEGRSKKKPITSNTLGHWFCQEGTTTNTSSITPRNNQSSFCFSLFFSLRLSNTSFSFLFSNICWVFLLNKKKLCWVFPVKVDNIFIIRATIFCCPSLTLIRTVSTAGLKKKQKKRKRKEKCRQKHCQTSRSLNEGLEMPYG